MACLKRRAIPLGKHRSGPLGPGVLLIIAEYRCAQMLPQAIPDFADGVCHESESAWKTGLTQDAKRSEVKVSLFHGTFGEQGFDNPLLARLKIQFIAWRSRRYRAIVACHVFLLE